MTNNQHRARQDDGRDDDPSFGEKWRWEVAPALARAAEATHG
jgi:hypothetical protein